MTDDELMNELCDGSTAALAKKPKHVPTLLEQYGLCKESLADQFCQAIDDYIANRITEQQMFAIMGSKKLIPK